MRMPMYFFLVTALPGDGGWGGQRVSPGDGSISPPRPRPPDSLRRRFGRVVSPLPRPSLASLAPASFSGEPCCHRNRMIGLFSVRLPAQVEGEHHTFRIPCWARDDGPPTFVE